MSVKIAIDWYTHGRKCAISAQQGTNICRLGSTNWFSLQCLIQFPRVRLVSWIEIIAHDSVHIVIFVSDTLSRVIKPYMGSTYSRRVFSQKGQIKNTSEFGQLRDCHSKYNWSQNDNNRMELAFSGRRGFVAVIYAAGKPNWYKFGNLEKINYGLSLRSLFSKNVIYSSVTKIPHETYVIIDSTHRAYST